MPIGLQPAFTEIIPIFLPLSCRNHSFRERSNNLVRNLSNREPISVPKRRTPVTSGLNDDNSTEDLNALFAKAPPNLSPEFYDSLMQKAKREQLAEATQTNLQMQNVNSNIFKDNSPGMQSKKGRQNQTDNRVIVDDDDDDDDDISDFFPESVVQEDELVSNDTHVVVDGSELANLIEHMKLQKSDGHQVPFSQSSGPRQTFSPQTASSNRIETPGNILYGDDDDENDETANTASSALLDPDGAFESALLEAAERLSDERYARSSKPKDEASSQTPESKPIDRNEGTERNHSESRKLGVMEYFTDENAMYMPSWARDIYNAKKHDELQEGADQLVPNASTRRLHDIVERRQASEAESVNVTHGDGVIDCSVGDVASDYHVPVEFVVDALIAFGVPTPINSSTSVRDSMTSDEVSRLLRLVSTHDPVTLSIRYSDKCIEEVADDYDIPVEDFMAVCEKEGLYLFDDEKTHLSVIREDRVLDILLKGEPFGRPYPPLLDGLE